MRGIVICAKYAVEHVQTRGVGALLSQIWHYCMNALKICAVVSSLVGNLVFPSPLFTLKRLSLFSFCFCFICSDFCHPGCDWSSTGPYGEFSHTITFG